MFCSKCGMQSLDDSKFCEHCGAPLMAYGYPQGYPQPYPKKEWHDNAFFGLIKPALEYVDKGTFFRRPFQWLYILLAVASLLMPIAALIGLIDEDIFSASFKLVFPVILSWLVMCVVCWFGFQLWWHRSKKVLEVSKDGDEFVATPVLSHFIQTLGEWFGMVVGVTGALSSLFLLIAGRDARYVDEIFPFASMGFWGILVSILVGFFLVLLTRWFAESMRALTAIANNTKR